MPGIGYFIIFCTCDKCGDEAVFRAGSQKEAQAKGERAGWRRQGERELLCRRCQPVVVCRFCNNRGCIACRGERLRILRKATMRLVK